MTFCFLSVLTSSDIWTLSCSCSLAQDVRRSITFSASVEDSFFRRVTHSSIWEQHRRLCIKVALTHKSCWIHIASQMAIPCLEQSVGGDTSNISATLGAYMPQLMSGSHPKTLASLASGCIWSMSGEDVQDTTECLKWAAAEVTWHTDHQLQITITWELFERLKLRIP